MVSKFLGSWRELCVGSQLGRDPTSLQDLIDARLQNDKVRKCEFAYLRQMRMWCPQQTPGADARTLLALADHLPPRDHAQAPWDKMDAIEAELSRQRRGVTRCGQVEIAGPTSVCQPSGGCVRTVGGSGPLMQGAPVTAPDADSGVAVSRGRALAAAVAFAMGDVVSAELVLTSGAASRGGDRGIDVWLCLFDLYRATGQVEAFSPRARAFVKRFGRSAPMWENWTPWVGAGSESQAFTAHSPPPVLADTRPVQTSAFQYALSYQEMNPSDERVSGALGVASGVPAVEDSPARARRSAYHLSGSVLGDQRPWTLDWVPPASPSLPWLIDCHRLVRIDLAAAGDLVGWLRLQHAAGYRVHLRGINCLVRTLLLSMHAGDWAHLTARQY